MDKTLSFTDPIFYCIESEIRRIHFVIRRINTIHILNEGLLLQMILEHLLLNQ